VVKLAKRKAEELEDFGEAAPVAPSKYSRQEMEEGAKLVEDVFRAWTVQNHGTRVEAAEDVLMSETNEDEAVTQLEQLQIIFNKYRPQIEANPWCREIIESL